MIGGDRLSLAGATLLNGYLITAVTMCDVAPLDPDPRHARSDAAGAGDRRARRRCRAAICWSRSPPACEVTTRIGIGARLSGVPRPRLARTRRARAVRRRGRGRPAARLRRRDHGEGVRPRRQPGRRHVRRVGHADGEIPSVPRRAVGPDGGAARRAEVPGDTRIPHRQGRRPLQQPTPTAESPTLATADLGQRWELEQIALRLWPSASLDAGHEHRAVRSGRASTHRSRTRSRRCACR